MQARIATEELAVDWTSRFVWLHALGSRRSRGVAESDPAGMGTAFGLDAATPDTDHAVVEARSNAEGGPAARPSWAARVVRRSGR